MPHGLHRRTVCLNGGHSVSQPRVLSHGTLRCTHYRTTDSSHAPVIVNTNSIAFFFFQILNRALAVIIATPLRGIYEFAVAGAQLKGNVSDLKKILANFFCFIIILL